MRNDVIRYLFSTVFFCFVCHTVVADDKVFDNPNFTKLIMYDLFVQNECPPQWLPLLKKTKLECLIKLNEAKKQCFMILVGDNKKELSDKKILKISTHYNVCQIFTVLGCKYDKHEFEKFFEIVNKHEDPNNIDLNKQEQIMVEKYLETNCPIALNNQSANN